MFGNKTRDETRAASLKAPSANPYYSSPLNLNQSPSPYAAPMKCRHVNVQCGM